MTTFETELPAAFLDSVLEDAVPGTAGLSPVLINRDPEPGEFFILHDTLVSLEIAALGAGVISLPDVEVFVNGVSAFAAGVFNVGFNGARSAYSNPQSNVLRVVVDPIAEFASEELVTVRVRARTVGDLGLLDESYTFTVEDFVGPRIVSADAIGLDRVRVTFNESVNLESTLDVANWTLERLGDYVTPVVSASVVLVEPSVAGGPSAIEFTTDVSLTPNGVYQVSTVGVVDQSDNSILPEFGVVLFEGWVPPSPAGRNFDLYQKFADFNRAEDDTLDLLRWVGILQEVSSLLLYDIDRFIDTFDPDTAPENMVDAMLADLGNPFDFDLTLTDKRRLANVLVAMYQLKGTTPGIENVIRFFLQLEARVIPYNTRANTWTLGESELSVSTSLGTRDSRLLYSFDVEVLESLDETTRGRLRSIVNYMRPGHTHFVNLREPAPPAAVIDHISLGESLLGVNWLLHEGAPEAPQSTSQSIRANGIVGAEDFGQGSSVNLV